MHFKCNSIELKAWAVTSIIIWYSRILVCFRDIVWVGARVDDRKNFFFGLRWCFYDRVLRKEGTDSEFVIAE